jgi:hypothetical protein
MEVDRNFIPIILQMNTMDSLKIVKLYDFLYMLWALNIL